MNETDDSQSKHIADEMDHLFKLFDEELALNDIPVSKRPFEATIALIKSGLINIRFGEEDPVDLSKPWDHVTEPWFRALYKGAKHWYAEHYGKKALTAKGNPPLRGVTLIRDTPFLVKVPMHRTEIVEEGRKAWMYFEEGVGKGEDPVDWLIDPPNLDKMEKSQRDADIQRLTTVCEHLRGINFRLLGAGTDDVSAGFRRALRSYLESAAERIRVADPSDFGPAWSDLQLAIENGVKLAHQTVFGSYKQKHNLRNRLDELRPHGVVFDLSRLDDWPIYDEISDLRYAQAPAGGIATLFAAYQLCLEVVLAALAVIKPPLGSGSGFLLTPAPWLVDSDGTGETMK